MSSDVGAGPEGPLNSPGSWPQVVFEVDSVAVSDSEYLFLWLELKSTESVALLFVVDLEKAKSGRAFDAVTDLAQPT